MEITIDRTFEFIPKWNDNDKTDNPVIVTGYMLTGEQYSRCVKLGTEMAIDGKRYLKEARIKIRNLVVNGKPIVNVEDLLRVPGLILLYNEIVAEVINLNAFEPSKNLELPST
jgi:NRPS condensation-like uncharacterized protein